MPTCTHAMYRRLLYNWTPDVAILLLDQHLDAQRVLSVFSDGLVDLVITLFVPSEPDCPIYFQYRSHVQRLALCAPEVNSDGGTPQEILIEPGSEVWTRFWAKVALERAWACDDEVSLRG